MSSLEREIPVIIRMKLAELNMSLNFFCKKYNISYPSLSKYVNQRQNNITLATLEKVCNKLDLSIVVRRKKSVSGNVA